MTERRIVRIKMIVCECYVLQVTGEMPFTIIEEFNSVHSEKFIDNPAWTLPFMRDWFRNRGYKADISVVKTLPFYQRFVVKVLMVGCEMIWRWAGMKMFEGKTV